MNDNSIWFGRAGSLRQLWAPTGGIIATRERDTSIFTNKTGGTRTTKALDGARQYALNYGVLGRANFEYLNQFAQGHMGPGPFVLIDPGRRNMLTVNQSSATSQTGDTRGFVISSGSGSSIASVVSPWGGLPNMLTWTFSTAAPASPALLLSKPSNVPSWSGIPVLQRPYTFWCTCVGSPMDLQMRVDWFSTSGFMSQNFGGIVTSNATVPQRLGIRNVTPPVGAAWAVCYVAPVSATIGAGEAISFLDFTFQEGFTWDPAWTGGTGVYPVSFVGMPEKYGFDEPGMLVAPTAILQEVR